MAQMNFEIETQSGHCLNPRGNDVLIKVGGLLTVKKWGAGSIEFEYDSNGSKRITGRTIEETAKSLVARLRSDADLIEKYFTDESTNQG